MNTLPMYMWKEWREHRRALLAVALICTVMMTCFAWLLATRRVLADPLFPTVSCACAVLIALLAVGGELLAERHTGGLAWLQRMPAGLATPFWVKLGFHTFVTLASGALGLALALAAAWLRGVAPDGLDAHLSYPVLFLVSLLALWTFAASAWNSRSVLALFGAAFVVAGLGEHIWVLGSRGYQPKQWEVATCAALLLFGAIPSAWLGFVTAGRFGRSAKLALLLGSSPALVAFLPTWAWGAWQFHLRDRFDPSFDSFGIVSAVVTEDARTAFIEAWNWNDRWDPEALPRYVLRVNLESGRSELIRRGNVEMVADRFCTDADVLRILDRDESDKGVVLFDLESGAPMGSKGLAETPDRCREWLRATPPFTENVFLFDAFDGRTVHPADLSLPRDAWLWGDLGRWYVISRREGAFLLDPDSKTLARAEWLDPVDFRFGPRLADGRFFAPLRDGGVGLVDPEQARVVPLLSSEECRDDCARVYRAYGASDLPFEEDQVVLVRTGRKTYRFDAEREALELVPFLGVHRTVGCAPDGSLFVIVADKELVRFDVATQRYTFLFPRSR